MSLPETIVIFMVALIVFGPDKLPELAKHVGKLVAKGRHLKSQFDEQWQKQQRQFELDENLKKAEEADKKYRS
tara:strand:+ start:757 stop:975 length:219 start_codon:yes stop_codon:yes gene_type:complete